MDLDRIQHALRDAMLDGWLFYDHHQRDPLAYRILQLDANAHVTRRWFYLIPASGTPRKLVHRIEAGRLDTLPGETAVYSSWQELEAGMTRLLRGRTRLAMQYSPNNAIMAVSLVDAGTVELLRGMGKEIVSSADLVSRFEAVLTDAQIETHRTAQHRLDEILLAGWQRLRDARAGNPTATMSEFALAEFFREAIARAGMVTEHGPSVSAGANSADSHYEPTPERHSPIRSGDFLLVDIWAKLANDPSAVWYDITWTGVVSREPSAREQTIFRLVRSARDAAIAKVDQAFRAKQPIAGCEADDAAREVLRAAGLEANFTHRTGHNIGTELHGAGAHLDNLETHDLRRLLPNTCFSVEPGLYFPAEFGVRSEVNMVARADGATVTGPRQTELVRI